MSQTRWESVVETVTNIGSGMVIAYTISQAACYLSPYIDGFEWNITASSNLIMTVIFTVVSIGRSYVWRRYFNRKEEE